MNDSNSSKRFILVLLITSLIATLAIGGYFYLQRKSPDSSITAVPAKKPITIVNSEKTPAVAEALTALFGVKTTADKIANAADQLSSLWFEQTFNQHNGKFHAFFIKTQNIDSETKTIADSHADAANISVVVYKQVGEQWQFDSKQLNVGSFGSWGDVPDIKRVKTLQLSPDNLAFLIDSSFSGQGFTEEGYGLFGYNAKTKVWKDLGFVQTAGDNAGACDDSPQPADSALAACWKFTGEITVAQSGKNPAYPDLLIKHQGTGSDDENKVIPVTDRLYIFNGEQYVEEGAEAR